MNKTPRIGLVYAIFNDTKINDKREQAEKTIESVIKKTQKSMNKYVTGVMKENITYDWVIQNFSAWKPDFSNEYDPTTALLRDAVSEETPTSRYTPKRTKEEITSELEKKIKRLNYVLELREGRSDTPRIFLGLTKKGLTLTYHDGYAQIHDEQLSISGKIFFKNEKDLFTQEKSRIISNRESYEYAEVVENENIIE